MQSPHHDVPIKNPDHEVYGFSEEAKVCLLSKSQGFTLGKQKCLGPVAPRELHFLPSAGTALQRSDTTFIEHE